jgi:SEFIR domain-containing protein
VPSPPPKVFLTYSHDSYEHVERALGLSQRLREDGVDSWIDQYENGTPGEGWPRWMLNRLEWANFVLIICSETYYRRFRGKDEPGTGKGADWEGQLVTLDIYDSKSRTVKFVPVFFEDRYAQFIPEPLRVLTSAQAKLIPEVQLADPVLWDPGPARLVFCLRIRASCSEGVLIQNTLKPRSSSTRSTGLRREGSPALLDQSRKRPPQQQSRQF